MKSNAKLEVFFDGDCPLCRKEISMLRGWDKQEKIIFTNIADPAFDAELSTGKSLDELMREIHARFINSPTGGESKELDESNWLIGVDVFRQLYGLLGFRKSVAISRIGWIDRVLNFGYRVFAFYRYKGAMKRLANQRCKNGCKTDEKTGRKREKMAEGSPA